MTGSGIPNDPYLISSVDDFMLIADDLTACYKLTVDIDLTDIEFYCFATYSDYDPYDAFTGIFDGAGHSIKNWTFDGFSGDGFGLFKSAKGAILKNVTFRDCNCLSYVGYAGHVVFTSKVGMLVGYAENTNIYNCKVINTHLWGGEFVGGLIGEYKITDSNEYYVNKCHFDFDLVGFSSVGGIIGWLNIASSDADFTMHCCNSEGTIMPQVLALHSAGGLIGIITAGDFE